MTEDEETKLQEWQDQELQAGMQEFLQADVIASSIKYRQFVSKSKGMRNLSSYG